LIWISCDLSESFRAMQYAAIIEAEMRSQVRGRGPFYSSPMIDEISWVSPAAISRILLDAIVDRAYTTPLRVRRDPRALVREKAGPL